MKPEKVLGVLTAVSMILFCIPAVAQWQNDSPAGEPSFFEIRSGIQEIRSDDSRVSNDLEGLATLGLAKAFWGHSKKCYGSGPLRKILKGGAHRLCDLQADIIADNANNVYEDDDPDDGGWDWELSPTAMAHSPAPSPENTYGVTALGLISAYLWGRGEYRFLMGMLDAYLGMEARAEVDSAPDIVYLVFLGHLLNNQGFFELARNKYDKKVADLGGALGLAEDIRDVRGGAGHDGLIPFDLGWFVWAARTLDFVFPWQGYLNDAYVYGQVIAQDIHNPEGFFDIDDLGESYYILGIACAMHAMQQSGADLSLVPILRKKLIDLQLPDGSWYFNQNFPDSDYQSTAYAVQKLSFAWVGIRGARAAARAGARWLAARQLSTGGWEYVPGVENTEINGEILFALFRVSPVVFKSKMNQAKTKINPTQAKSRRSQRSRPPIANPLAF